MQPDHVTPYDRFAWSDRDVELLLASGERRAELEAYFGESEYRVLVRLARAAQRADHSKGPRTLIIPGIMGSQLGRLRAPPLPPDVLWLDPVDIGAGRLTALATTAGEAIRSLGVVLHSYLRLKLQLRAAGVDAVLHDYDWRLGIDVLGPQLAARLHAESAPRLAIVAHSMGGLVCRAALALPAGRRVERVVLVASPNQGSFAAVQALRGTYAVVRKVASLDQQHSAESLAAEVFSSFPSLYHLLPARSGRLTLTDPAAWPGTPVRPRTDLLQAAHAANAQLAPADERFSAVVGVGEETVTAVARRAEQFIYSYSRRGDGTVPLMSAELPGAAHYYAPVAHSELARDERVGRAIADLITHGSTRRLPRRWASRSRALALIGDSALRRTHCDKVDWAALSVGERREFLQNLNEPPRLKLKVPRGRGA
ncbi:MAG TPA: hypothetical protein VLW26_06140 [Steroidobacteraceae bacterium]|nr:hypothetical protein [Steroidobacteraceae bacterium]